MSQQREIAFGSRTCLAVAAVAVAGSANVCADYSFTRIGALSGPNGWSRVAGLSADGSTVIGRSDKGNNTFEAFSWTHAGGMRSLGSLHFGLSAAQGVSASGGLIVGNSGHRSFQRQEAFVWSDATDMQPIQEIENALSSAWDISSDGSTIVGEFGEFPEVGFVVTYGTSDITMLNPLPGGARSSARSVSADGAIIAGWADNAEYLTHAVRWDADRVAHDLGTLGGPTSYASDVSSDGRVIVGASQLSDQFEDGHAFRWTEAGGMEDIHTLDFEFSIAWSASADGGVIVGELYDEPFVPAGAFIWDAQHGMRDLSEILKDGGVDLTGWTLARARGISADGTVISGDGLNPDGIYEGWIATVPAPASLLVLGLGAVVRRRRA